MQIFQCNAIFWVGKIGNLFRSHGEQYHLLVQNFVMFEIVKQGERRPKSISGHIDRGSRHAPDTLAFQFREKYIEWNANFAKSAAKNTASLSPR